MKYYVDNAVSGSGSGSSWSAAWKEFSNIRWDIIKPGDTIYVSGGSTSQTYTQTLAVGASGSSAGAVLITKGQDAGHDGAVVIDGRNTLGNGIALNGRNYVTVDGLSVRNISDAGISVKGATAGVVIQNNSVYSGDPGGGNARGYDVRNSVGTDAVIVRNNSFSTPASTRAQTDGIWSSGNDGVVYEHNRIVVSNSDTTGHSDGFQSFQDRNVTVRDNWFEQAGTAITDNHGAWISNTQTGGTVTFRNNTVVAPRLTRDSAVTHYMEATWSGKGTADISDNTIIGGRRAVNIDGSPNVQVRNNILVPADQGWGYVIANASVPAGNIDNNLVWAPNGSIANVSNATLTQAQWQARGYDRNGLVADPAFTNPAANDYSVSASSPALGHGAASFAATPVAAVSVVPAPVVPAPVVPVPAVPAPVPAPVAAVPVMEVPMAPDTLNLRVSEDAWQGHAQFTVMIDDVAIGGVNTATASHAAGLSQDLSIAGNWGSGPHKVGIAFINDAWGGTPTTDRNLYVDQVTYDGQGASGAPAALFSNGTANFFTPSAATGAATALTLHLAEDAWQGDAQYSVSVDGKPLGQNGTVTALDRLGQSQAATLQTVLSAGKHDISVSFLNDAWGGTPTTDRNLYVKGIDVNGAPAPGTAATLWSAGTAHFEITVAAS